MPDAHDKAAHKAHLRVAEHTDLAAQAHRTAAEHNEKGDETSGELAFATRSGIFGSRLQACKGSP